MKKLSTYGAVASIFLLTAAPAALAQNYNPNYGNPNYGQDTNQNWNRSGSDWNRSGMQGGWNQGSDQGWNQGRYGAGNSGAGSYGAGNYGAGNSGIGNQGRYNSGWSQGSGSSQQGSMQQSSVRNRDTNGPTAQDAWQELSKYGYKNIGGMERAEGWQARATKNGERVFVFIDDEGTVATYRGAGQ
jgi:hypothetical protein